MADHVEDRQRVAPRTTQRRRGKPPIPTLSHSEVMDLLVDYHFGRLPARMNAAVEAHVRSCSACQRQGLTHAPTERREILRRLRRVRPARALVSRRGRVVLLVLTVLLLGQLGVYEIVTQSRLFFGSSASAGAHATATAARPTATPTPTVLKPSITFDVASTASLALAVSQDGQTLASVVAKGNGYAIQLWNTSTGKLSDSLPWPGQAAPGAVAWSADGRQLAAADGGDIAAWDVASRTARWVLTLPAEPAMRVYDVQAGDVLERPDPTQAFANGPYLFWGANGHLTQPPQGASGVAQPAGPLVGLWQVSGTHVFSPTKGSASIGISPDDSAHHQSVLTWSPDGHYLLWAALSKSTGTTDASRAASAPNALVAEIVGHVAAAQAGDALIWLSPDGHQIAACDRTSAKAALRVIDVATARVVATLSEACDQLRTASVGWLANGTGFALSLPARPIAIYQITPRAPQA